MVDLGNLLCPFRVVWAGIYLNDCLLPLLANVTLSGVTPVVALLNIVTAEDAREDYFVHITGHWVFNQKFERNLVDSHKKQCQLACWAFLLDFGRFNLSSLPLAIYFQLLLIFECVAIWVKLIDSWALLFVVNATCAVNPRSQRWNSAVHHLLYRLLLLFKLFLSFLNLVNEYRNFCSCLDLINFDILRDFAEVPLHIHLLNKIFNFKI